LLPHLGSNTDDFRAHQQVVYQLARYPNVFADTSAVRQYDYIVEAIKRAGPQKLLFGSDGPWLHPGVEIEKIRLLGLPPEKEALILGGNVLRLLHSARVGAKRQLLPPIRRTQSLVPSARDGSPLSNGYPPLGSPR
jgi:predicted TIM-barrel fold metal-dependent hydrolase